MSEYEQARAWRKSLGLSVKKLSELTGFGPSSINSFESGKQPSGKPVAADAMRRYRLCCAAVHHSHHNHFAFQS